MDLTFQFAINIAKVREVLTENRHWVLANQLIESGTSIGANVREARNAESKPDFPHKFNIAHQKIRNRIITTTKYRSKINGTIESNSTN